MSECKPKVCSGNPQLFRYTINRAEAIPNPEKTVAILCPPGVECQDLPREEVTPGGRTTIIPDLPDHDPDRRTEKDYDFLDRYPTARRNTPATSRWSNQRLGILVCGDGITPEFSGSLPTGITIEGEQAFIQAGMFKSTKSQAAADNIAMTYLRGAVNSDGFLCFTIEIPCGCTGADYYYQIDPPCGIAPFTFNPSLSESAPLGLVLDSSGVMSGVTELSGPFSFGVEYVDSKGRNYHGTIMVRFVSIEADAALPSADVDTDYTFTFTETGAVAPYRWTVVSGELPSGMTLDPNTGVLSGNCGVSGDYSFSIKLEEYVA